MTFGQKDGESAPRPLTPVPPNQGSSVAGSAANPSDSTPVLRVLNADATPEEIAVLVAVFSALGSAASAPAEPVSEWASHHRKVRRTVPHGPGGWRSRALPH